MRIAHHPKFVGRNAWGPETNYHESIRELERAGLIERGRGQLTILDRPRLMEASCECYRLVRERIALRLPKTYTE